MHHVDQVTPRAKCAKWHVSVSNRIAPVSDLAFRVELTPPDIEPYRAGNTGIDYVTTFESGVAGPHVLVTALTHGNEVCGAIALDRLYRAGLQPRQGKLTLAFDNIAAYRSFDPRVPTAS